MGSGNFCVVTGNLRDLLCEFLNSWDKSSTAFMIGFVINNILGAEPPTPVPLFFIASTITVIPRAISVDGSENRFLRSSV